MCLYWGRSVGGTHDALASFLHSSVFSGENLQMHTGVSAGISVNQHKKSPTRA